MRHLLCLFLILGLACNQSAVEKGNKKTVTDVKSEKTVKEKDKMGFNKLTKEEEYIIVNKGTERAFTGELNNHYAKGLYACKRCDAILYRSESKFKSGCGWPSFDDEVSGAVKRVPDADGRRVEIVCNKCDAHLGHVFTGEKFTAKNTRHCVNSLSMSFIPEDKFERAIFASGCFWGTEHHLNKADGVLAAVSGYIGGTVKNPTYKQICTGTTGHAEAVEVIYDPTKTNFETLAKLYFETHDPTQLNRQGPDIGTQYRSEVFYIGEEQRETTLKLIKILKGKGLNVVTKLTEAPQFWDAEGYHQDYYKRKGTLPYCHTYEKKFD